MMGGFGLGFRGILWVVLIIVGGVLFRQYSKGEKRPLGYRWYLFGNIGKEVCQGRDQ
jgi:hypothetical protein